MNLPKDLDQRVKEVIDMWQEESKKRLEADQKIVALVQELAGIIEKEE